MIMARFEDVFSSMVYPKAKILLYLVYSTTHKACVLAECNRTIGSLKLLYIEFVETMSLSLVSRFLRLNNPFCTSLDQAKWY